MSAEETTFQLRIGPVSSPNDFNCIGEELTVKETLYRNMYIGPNWACPQGGYRFGLDNEGYLGAWDYDGAVWNSGFKGDHLRLQDDGNLVLRDEMEHAVWASNCYGPDVTLKKSNSRAVRAIAGNGTTVWGIYGNQETRCYPTGDAPEIKCRGTMLSPGERLYPNEYLCGVLGPVQRFGLNDNGKLDLWYGNRCMWSPDHHADGGHFLSMNDDGNLVLYKDRPEGRSAQWASSCYFANSVLKLSGEGVAVEKRNGEVLWRIENDGTESECYPQETEESDCSAVSFFRGNVCRITMVDLLNLRVVHIEAKDLGDGQFTVVDNYDGKSCPSDVAWEATIEVPSDKNEDFTFLDSNPARGVNCVELLEQYQMKDQDYGEHSMWLSFLPHEETPCTHFGRSLIYFMVNEWFYFG